jgi:hypothetical protein
VNGESVLGTESDPRLELVARELSKLKKEDLDRIVGLLSILRSTKENQE